MKKLIITLILSVFLIGCASAPKTLIETTGCDTKVVKTFLDNDSVNVAIKGLNTMGFEVREQTIDQDQESIKLRMVNDEICSVEAVQKAKLEKQGAPIVETKVFSVYNETKLTSKIRKFESAGWQEVQIDEAKEEICEDKTKQALLGTKQVNVCKPVTKFTVIMERKL
jgi:hypothetical protein